MIVDLSFPTSVPTHESWNQLDSSKLGTYLDCPRKYFFEYILGWRPDRPNNHLSFGTAWHEAMEHLSLQGFSQEAVRLAWDKFMTTYRKDFPIETDPETAPKDPANAMLALQTYAALYSKIDAELETLYTEVSFRVPIDADTEMIGRLDGIVRDHKDNKIKLKDYKTGSRVDRLWEQQWNLSVQMGTYYHAMLCIYEPAEFGGIIVDGTFFKKGGNEFKRKLVLKSIEMAEAWLNDTVSAVNDLKRDFERLRLDSPTAPTMKSFRRNPQSCTKYYGCPFLDLCSVWPNPLARAADGPPPSYKLEWWDPEHRDKPAKAEIVAGEIKKVEEPQSVPTTIPS